LRIGIHTSISGSLEKAALKAAQLGANTFQIFSSSPRMWRPSLPDPADIRRLRAAREKYDLYPLVIHDNYLINMASCTEDIRIKSVAAFRAEIERATAIGAEYLVAHPGSCKGHTVELGIATFCRSLGEAARGLKTRGLTMLIENTAGAGQALGARLEELAVMKQFAAEFTDLRVAFCIDTCHLMAAGYDVASPEGLAATVRRLDDILGLDHIPVIHANDTKTPLGSRVDRHEHIGEGYIGKEGFRRILFHPKLRGKAFIAETPVDNEGDDLRNVQMLKCLCPKSRTTTKKSS
jgi:deoxyribonuclease-4